MNHLAHFKVSHPDPGLIVGGFLGDFVKGRLNGEHSPSIERGIALHRAVDAFSDQHPITRRSVARFSKPFRRYGPIMVDVIFDHFLATAWSDYSEQDLVEFSDAVLSIVAGAGDRIPQQPRQTALRMQANQTLVGYSNESFIERSLTHIGTRLTRDNPLHEAFSEYQAAAEELRSDFTLFFPELVAYCDQWQQDNP